MPDGQHGARQGHHLQARGRLGIVGADATSSGEGVVANDEHARGGDDEEGRGGERAGEAEAEEAGAALTSRGRGAKRADHLGERMGIC